MPKGMRRERAVPRADLHADDEGRRGPRRADDVLATSCRRSARRPRRCCACAASRSTTSPPTYARERGIIIADTKFEFGFIDGELHVIDEILTPDSSRFWDADDYKAGESQPSFDKQYVRDWLAQSGWNKEPPAPELPADVVAGHGRALPRGVPAPHRPGSALVATAIRPARADDVPFMAEVRLMAERSHVQRGPSDLYIDGSEADVLAYLEAVADADTPNPFQYRTHLIAEVDGELAAALCGFCFEDYEADPAKIEAAMQAIAAKCNLTQEQHEAGYRRVESWGLVHPVNTPGAWIIECVAAVPAHRRQGLIARLLAEVLAMGKQRGATTAEVTVYIGNDAAQRAYEGAGFEVVSEQRHPDFEAVFGFPGMRLLRRSI